MSGEGRSWEGETPLPETEAGSIPASFARGGVLTPDDLRIAGERLWGRWGWQTRLAEALEVDGSTVRRWLSGAVAVPGPAKVAIRLMLGGEEQAPPQPAAPEGKRPSRPRSTLSPKL
jgi:hypothetical protein